MATDASRPPPEQLVDWEDARRRLRAAIRVQLGRVDPDDLDDLASEALIHLLRVLRRDGAVRNLPGLVKVVARSTAIDEIRRRRRASLRRGLPVEGDAEPAQPDPDDWDDRVQTDWFLMLEFFAGHRAPCRALARAYAELGDWKAVAASVGSSHDAVRQQWSRCRRAYLAALRRGGGPRRGGGSDDG